jgi:hypothetical protein
LYNFLGFRFRFFFKLNICFCFYQNELKIYRATSILGQHQLWISVLILFSKNCDWLKNLHWVLQKDFKWCEASHKLKSCSKFFNQSEFFDEKNKTVIHNWCWPKVDVALYIYLSIHCSSRNIHKSGLILCDIKGCGY